uniref:Uncharacterized protein n=1 Tax=Corethron hystrix TaxID=216773 RepID=A0A7S1FQK7_9STRA|mmetsp:Transcript_21110/g.47865  ORF Transcript_21110/g.47865 Transcript_21110/m.47865 type:complete len:150 (+) Transcript_21110:146-595(+)
MKEENNINKMKKDMAVKEESQELFQNEPMQEESHPIMSWQFSSLSIDNEVINYKQNFGAIENKEQKKKREHHNMCVSVSEYDIDEEELCSLHETSRSLSEKTPVYPSCPAVDDIKIRRKISRRRPIFYLGMRKESSRLVFEENRCCVTC